LLPVVPRSRPAESGSGWAAPGSPRSGQPRSGRRVAPAASRSRSGAWPMGSSTLSGSAYSSHPGQPSPKGRTNGPRRLSAKGARVGSGRVPSAFSINSTA